MTPAQRSLRARLGAYVLHSRYDSRELTAKARATFLSKFEHEVDPEGQLAPEERARRAEMAKKAHFTRMALKSATRRAKGRRT